MDLKKDCVVLTLGGRKALLRGDVNALRNIRGCNVELHGGWHTSSKGRHFRAESFRVKRRLSKTPLYVRIFGKGHVPSAEQSKTIEILRPALEYLVASGKKAAARKLASLKPNKALDVKSDPYTLSLKRWVEFDVADEMALLLAADNDVSRINAAAEWLLRKADCFDMPVEDLTRLVSEKIAREITPDILTKALKSSVVVVTKDRAATPSAYWTRRKTLDLAKKNHPTPMMGDDDIPDNLFGHRYAILTGEAGTGKTTVLRRLKKRLEGHGYTVAMTAMTGKAATLLGRDAVTLHKLLGFGNGGFSKRKADQDYVRADILEAAVIEDIKAMFRDEQFMARIWEEANKRLCAEKPDIEKEIRKVESRTAKTRASLDRYFEAFEAGTMKPELCNEKIEDLNDRIAELETEKRELEARRKRLELPAIDRAMLSALIDDFEEVMASGMNPQKKHLLKRLVKKVLVSNRRTVEIWYGLPNHTPVRTPGNLAPATGHSLRKSHMVAGVRCLPKDRKSKEIHRDRKPSRKAPKDL